MYEILKTSWKKTRRVITNQWRKLYGICSHQKDNLSQFRILTFYSKHGLEYNKLERVRWFKRKRRMKNKLDKKTEFKAKADTELGKLLRQNMSTSLYVEQLMTKNTRTSRNCNWMAKVSKKSEFGFSGIKKCWANSDDPSSVIGYKKTETGSINQYTYDLEFWKN